MFLFLFMTWNEIILINENNYLVIRDTKISVIYYKSNITLIPNNSIMCINNNINRIQIKIMKSKMIEIYLMFLY